MATEDQGATWKYCYTNQTTLSGVCTGNCIGTPKYSQCYKIIKIAIFQNLYLLIDEQSFELSVKYHARLPEESKQLTHKRVKESIAIAI